MSTPRIEELEADKARHLGTIRELRAKVLRLEEEARAEHWRCYHCRATFGLQDLLAAREHFGLTSAIAPQCALDAMAENALLRARLAELEPQP
jgi:hypothetical protein